MLDVVEKSRHPERAVTTKKAKRGGHFHAKRPRRPTLKFVPAGQTLTAPLQDFAVHDISVRPIEYLSFYAIHVDCGFDDVPHVVS